MVTLMRISEEWASRLVFKPLALLLRRRSVEIKSSSSAVSYTIPELALVAVDMPASLFSDFSAPEAYATGVVLVFETPLLFAVGVAVFESRGVTVSGEGAVDGDRSEDSETVGWVDEDWLWSGERGMDDISRSEDSSGTRGFFDFLERGLDSDPDPAEMASVSTQLEALTRRGS